jgi:hypothetical protein
MWDFGFGKAQSKARRKVGREDNIQQAADS